MLSSTCMALSWRKAGTRLLHSATGDAKSAQQAIERRLKKLALTEVPLSSASPSGDCQFRALAGALYSDENRHTEVRSRVASWLNTHQKVTLRVSSSPSSTETTQLDFEDFLSKDEYPSWKAYCVSVARPGSWGDHLSLIAAANTFNANIHVISGVAAATDEQATTLIEPQVVETKPASAPPSTIYLTHYPEYHYNYAKKNQKSL